MGFSQPSGSPPQVRGKLWLSLRAVLIVGITPAGAGKTSRCGRVKNDVRDHPRRCGENRKRKHGIRHTAGSPPQVRGKLSIKTLITLAQRITPAGAGKTRLATKARRAGWDHPRRCGENPAFSLLCAISTGSPPQVRGKLETAVPVGIPIGITPAGAGKTRRQEFLPTRPWDHPRRCGENHAPYESRLPYPGSPPQVRGKRKASGGITFQTRITPADAGKTRCTAGYHNSNRDHPRGCGENKVHGHSGGKLVGSPPRMRGKQLCSRRTRSPYRITPADAGKTVPVCLRKQQPQDHPRGCGENGFSASFIFISSGSPPRMRGKQTKYILLLQPVRITPADAGKTSCEI